MIKINNKGFGAVEVFLIILIVAIVGGAGWFVLKHRSKSTSSTSTTNTTNPVNKTNSLSQQKAKLSVISFASVDQDLQTSIKGFIAKNLSGCQTTDSKANNYLDLNASIRTYESNKAATVDLGCEGGAVYLFVDQSGSWKEVSDTQIAWTCSVVDKYKVPSKVISECLIESTGKSRQVTYM